jgi:hypothetical protein
MMKLALSPRRIYKEATQSRVPNDEVEVITSKDLQGSYKSRVPNDKVEVITSKDLQGSYTIKGS